MRRDKNLGGPLLQLFENKGFDSLFILEAHHSSEAIDTESGTTTTDPPEEMDDGLGRSAKISDQK